MFDWYHASDFNLLNLNEGMAKSDNYPNMDNAHRTSDVEPRIAPINVSYSYN